MVKPLGLWIWSFLAIFLRCVTTVWMERDNLSAISLLVNPFATKVTTFSSRGDRVEVWGFLSGVTSNCLSIRVMSASSVQFTGMDALKPVSNKFCIPK